MNTLYDNYCTRNKNNCHYKHGLKYTLAHILGEIEILFTMDAALHRCAS